MKIEGRHIIEVTEEHIAEGTEGSILECPIALAIRDKFPDITYVRVGSKIYIYFREADKSYEAVATKKACAFMNRFDNPRRALPEPTRFQLDFYNYGGK